MNFENAQVEGLFNDLAVKTDKAVDYMKSEFAVLRAGRANSKILDKIMVDYYGTMTAINQMGNMSTPDPRTVAITLWDKTAISKVEKAILAANIGLNPQNDGTIIRLVFPDITEERRKDLVKSVKKLAEDCKVAVRNVRRDCLECLKKLKTDKTISEDSEANYGKIVDKMITKSVENIDRLSKEKELDIMAV